MSVETATIGELLSHLEATGAGSMTAAYEDEAGKTVWAVIVIAGDEADERVAAWRKAEEDLHDRWDAEREATDA